MFGGFRNFSKTVFQLDYLKSFTLKSTLIVIFIFFVYFLFTPSYSIKEPSFEYFIPSFFLYIDFTILIKNLK